MIKQMKIIALDLGDAWVGSAISDGLGITCAPLQTVPLAEIETFLLKEISAQDITAIVIGLPITMGGQESSQTKKIIDQKTVLENAINQVYPEKIEWILWNERLSSKFASQTQVFKKNTAKKEAQKERLRQHSVAAAFILQSYLDYLAFQKNL